MMRAKRKTREGDFLNHPQAIVSGTELGMSQNIKEINSVNSDNTRLQLCSDRM